MNNIIRYGVRYCPLCHLQLSLMGHCNGVGICEWGGEILDEEKVIIKEKNEEEEEDDDG